MAHGFNTALSGSQTSLRLCRRSLTCTCLLVLGLVLSWSASIAGDFYVISSKQKTSWDKKIAGASRWKLVMDCNAVLDRETVLVWQKNTVPTAGTYNEACSARYKLELGVRMGWRLPTIEELATLIDTSEFDPALPAGNPFTDPVSSGYWSSSTCASDPDRAWYVEFYSGGVSNYYKTYPNYVRCVRGGHGHDAR